MEEVEVRRKSGMKLVDGHSRSFSLGFQSMSDPASIERANAFLFGSTKDVGVGGR